MDPRLGQTSRLAAAQVHLDDRGRPALADAHDDALAVRREARREGHAGEVADQLSLARLQVHEEHARLVAGVLHEGDFLRGGTEARGEHQLAPLAQQPHVGAVLIHHGKTLVAAILGSRLVDEHDLRVEVALLAGQALVDLVGDQMPQPAPIVLADDEALGSQLPPREHVPQPELGNHPAVRRPPRPADHHSLGIDQRASPGTAGGH